MRKLLFVAGIAILALVSSCGTQATGSALTSAQATQTADPQRIVDWQNRSLGEIASPPWLLQAVRGDWREFKNSWGQVQQVQGKVLKLGVATAANRNAAATIAEVQYAARLASQLKQSVLTRAAISLGSNGEFDTVNDAATKTHVTVAGQEQLTNFWQQVQTTDENGRKKTVYNYWVVYACDEAVWDKLVAKYLYDVVGELPDTKTQKTIAGLFAEIDRETKNEKALSEAQFKNEVAARQNALANPMSKEEQRAAYKSGDPAKIAAANTTSQDVDYVAALAALSAQ